MQAKFFAFAVVAAGLAGCAAGPTATSPSYATAASATEPGPAYNREMYDGRPGLFGDLRWNIDLSGKYSPVKTSEEEEFKKWRATSGNPERQEFEEWRAWQEWKRKNPQ